jgi:hypothetical protein
LKKLADNEHINQDPLDIPNSVEYVSAAGDSELSVVTDLNHLFFGEIFPSVVGHAKKILPMTNAIQSSGALRSLWDYRWRGLIFKSPIMCGICSESDLG